jgi:hypothetical protein
MFFPLSGFQTAFLGFFIGNRATFLPCDFTQRNGAEPYD